MIKKWISWTNYAALAIIAIGILASLYFYFSTQDEFYENDIVSKKSELPKNSFVRASKDYEALDSSIFSLNFSPLSVQLPDLRRFLMYYGKNGRPDAKDDNLAYYFAFTGNKAPTAIVPGEKMYVLYDKGQVPNQFVFSPDNNPTELWLEVQAGTNQAEVKVRMKGENNKEIDQPASYAQFTVPEKELARSGSTIWELGKWRVDGTILARQKARWYGIDKFLEKHGGEEYKDFQGKQRIDFGEGEDMYSVYAGLADCFTWKDNRWQNIKSGEDTLSYVLLCVKKIDDRVMSLELWDVGGKGKVNLNLVKAIEAWMPQNLEQSFKFLGARTRSQFVFEINKERVFLSPHDWLLLTDGVWKKLSSPKDIDDYVERKKIGPLFVFDRVERKDDRQVIIGSFINSARTEMVDVELPLQQGNSKLPGKKGDDKKQKNKETNPQPMIKTMGQGDGNPKEGYPREAYPQGRTPVQQDSGQDAEDDEEEEP